MPSLTEHPNREFEVLCLAARLPLDDAQQRRLAASAQLDINAEELTRLAIHHGLAPLLAHQLHRYCPALLTQALQQYAQRNAVRVQFLTQTLVEMMQTFDAAGVPAVPLKGAALALTAYGALGLRDFCDVDVLIHPAQLDEAESLCVAHGFARKHDLAHTHDADVRRFRYDLAMWRARDGILLELHWGLLFSYAGIAFERLPWWDTRESIVLNGQTLPALAPEETLLLLCLHGSKDGWDKLKHAADVAQFLRAKPGLDWPRVWQLAGAINAVQLVRIALRWADALLDAPLPAATRTALRQDQSLREPLRHAHALLHSELAADEKVVARQTFFLLTHRCWWEKLRYAWRYALSPGPTEWRRVELPASLGLVYRLLRLARLTKFYGLRWLSAAYAEK